MDFEIDRRRHNAIKNTLTQIYFGLWFHLLRFTDYIFHSISETMVRSSFIINELHYTTADIWITTVKLINFDRYSFYPAHGTSHSFIRSPRHHIYLSLLLCCGLTHSSLIHSKYFIHLIFMMDGSTICYRLVNKMMRFFGLSNPLKSISRESELLPKKNNEEKNFTHSHMVNDVFIPIFPQH